LEGQLAEERIAAAAERHRERGEVAGAAVGGGEHAEEVLREAGEAARRHGDAEVLSGHVFERVGLVEHHRVVGRENAQRLLTAARAQGEVREEERVVDDDDVDVGGGAAPAGDEARLVQGALAAQAGVAGGGDEGPAAPRLGDGRLDAVAGLGGHGPPAKGLPVARVFGAGERGRLVERLEALRAEVVRAALEQRGGEGQPHDVTQQRNVLREDLVLQGARRR
jgi:hypothetical protein